MHTRRQAGGSDVVGAMMMMMMMMMMTKKMMMTRHGTSVAVGDLMSYIHAGSRIPVHFRSITTKEIYRVVHK